MKTESSSTSKYYQTISSPNLEKMERLIQIQLQLMQDVNNEELTNVIYDMLACYPFYNRYDPCLEKNLCHLALGEEGVDDIIRAARLGHPISLYVLMLKKIFISPENYLFIDSENRELDDAIALFLAQDYRAAIETIDSYLEDKTSYDQEDAVQLRILAKALMSDYESAAADCNELGYGNRILQGSLLEALAGRSEEAMQKLRDFYRDIDSTMTFDSEESTPSTPKFRFTEEHFIALLLERIIAQ